MVIPTPPAAALSARVSLAHLPRERTENSSPTTPFHNGLNDRVGVDVDGSHGDAHRNGKNLTPSLQHYLPSDSSVPAEERSQTRADAAFDDDKNGDSSLFAGSGSARSNTTRDATKAQEHFFGTSCDPCMNIESCTPVLPSSMVSSRSSSSLMNVETTAAVSSSSCSQFRLVPRGTVGGSSGNQVRFKEGGKECFNSHQCSNNRVDDQAPPPSEGPPGSPYGDQKNNHIFTRPEPRLPAAVVRNFEATRSSSSPRGRKRCSGSLHSNHIGDGATSSALAWPRSFCGEDEEDEENERDHPTNPDAVGAWDGSMLRRGSRPNNSKGSWGNPPLRRPIAATPTLTTTATTGPWSVPQTPSSFFQNSASSSPFSLDGATMTLKGLALQSPQSSNNNNTEHQQYLLQKNDHNHTAETSSSWGLFSHCNGSSPFSITGSKGQHHYGHPSGTKIFSLSSIGAKPPMKTTGVGRGSADSPFVDPAETVAVAATPPAMAPPLQVVTHSDHCASNNNNSNKRFLSPSARGKNTSYNHHLTSSILGNAKSPRIVGPQKSHHYNTDGNEKEHGLRITRTPKSLSEFDSEEEAMDASPVLTPLPKVNLNPRMKIAAGSTSSKSLVLPPGTAPGEHGSSGHGQHENNFAKKHRSPMCNSDYNDGIPLKTTDAMQELLPFLFAQDDEVVEKDSLNEKKNAFSVGFRERCRQEFDSHDQAGKTMASESQEHQKEHEGRKAHHPVNHADVGFIPLPDYVTAGVKRQENSPTRAPELPNHHISHSTHTKAMRSSKNRSVSALSLLHLSSSPVCNEHWADPIDALRHGTGVSVENNGMGHPEKESLTSNDDDEEAGFLLVAPIRIEEEKVGQQQQQLIQNISDEARPMKHSRRNQKKDPTSSQENEIAVECVGAITSEKAIDSMSLDQAFFFNVLSEPQQQHCNHLPRSSVNLSDWAPAENDVAEEIDQEQGKYWKEEGFDILPTTIKKNESFGSHPSRDFVTPPAMTMPAGTSPPPLPSQALCSS